MSDLLCTKCNAPVRPVVAFDIDGTLGRYHEHFIQFACNWLDRQLPLRSYDGAVPLNEYLQIDLQTYRQCKLAYRQGGMKRLMPPYGEARETLAALRQTGAEVWLTTTRPYMRLDNVDPDTREWLRRREFVYDGLLYDEDKYKVLMDVVGKDRIVGILDDDPEQFEAAQALGLPVWLIRRQHNRLTDSLFQDRVLQTLTQAAGVFIEAIEGWKRNVQSSV